MLWAIWKSKNRLVFEGTSDSPLDFWNRAEVAFTEFSSTQLLHETRNSSRPNMQDLDPEHHLWSPPRWDVSRFVDHIRRWSLSHSPFYWLLRSWLEGVALLRDLPHSYHSSPVVFFMARDTVP
ncbi:hypothetical protein V6N11_063285 [Hibiscus sabdariffa]|uniref:Uncharacterized protein n=1 Tax=Hibiscus sabdariffa TaxID=183260 RepID=A0ABR2NGL3_9ROSI